MNIVFPRGRLRTFAAVPEANSAARAGEILPITRSAPPQSSPHNSYFGWDFAIQATG